MWISFCFDLFCSEKNELFFKGFIWLCEPSYLFLSIVTRDSHFFNVMLKTANPFVQNLILLGVMISIIIELVHFIVMHLDISCQVCASALIHGILLTELGIFKLNFAQLLLHFIHLSILFLTLMMSCFYFFSNYCIVALESTLKLSCLFGIYFEVSVFTSEFLNFTRSMLKFKF